MQSSYTIGHRTFVLDRAKAEAALAAKRVVGGRETMTFNLLPLRYGWAYELYRTMKANHWEPEDVPMAADVEQWRDPRRAERDRPLDRPHGHRLLLAPPRGSSATTSSTSSASWSPRPSSSSCSAATRTRRTSTPTRCST